MPNYPDDIYIFIVVPCLLVIKQEKSYFCTEKAPIFTSLLVAFTQYYFFA